MSEKDKPSTSKGNENDNASDKIPIELNILSEDFDPTKALYASNIKKPEKLSIKQYSNIAKFQTALNNVGILQVGMKQKRQEQNKLKRGEQLVETQTKYIAAASASIPERRFEEYQMPVPGKPAKVRNSRNLLKKMDEYKEGPLSVLYNAWQSQKKIIVYVRKEHGVRGYIYGYLVTFDKHTNLLLKNCYEIWKRRKFKFSPNNATLGSPTNCSRRLKNLGIKLPEMETKSIDRKYVIVKRKIDQIVIRGTQVCLVRFVNKNDEEKLVKCIL